jgi:very-short-patch-repair endonuclease
MKIRVESVFILLGLKYRSEVEISGRYIDFLIEENIILEVDGTFHIDVMKLEADDVTQSRNIHMIYAGYRVILINIY